MHNVTGASNYHINWHQFMCRWCLGGGGGGIFLPHNLRRQEIDHHEPQSRSTAHIQLHFRWFGCGHLPRTLPRVPRLDGWILQMMLKGNWNITRLQKQRYGNGTVTRSTRYAWPNADLCLLIVHAAECNKILVGKMTQKLLLGMLQDVSLLSGWEHCSFCWRKRNQTVEFCFLSYAKKLLSISRNRC